jgi:hypothetical protein
MWWTTGLTTRPRANFRTAAGQPFADVFGAAAGAGEKTFGGAPVAQQDNHKLLFSLVMFEQWLRGNDMEFEEIEC